MLNNRKLLLSCMAVLLLFAGMPYAYAQKTVTAKGVVVDDTGLSVPGAAVIEVGSPGNGTVTGAHGEFSILVPVGAQLEVSCIGFANQTVKFSGKDLRIVLTEDALFLDEVVVVGYGVQKKEYMTSSVVSVTSKDLQKAPQTNVSAMLAGKLPGVTAIQTTGTPGADQADIIVRGFSTYGANNRPMYIIDGMESGQMVNLNPSDIESISVLKDAAAAAVYGIRGGNGVIIITTKQGSKAGRANVSYDGSYTLTKNVDEPELLAGEEYIYWHNRLMEQDGRPPIYTPENIALMKERGIYGETDWRSLIYNKYGTMQQHNIAVDGGNDKVSYFGSIGYLDQIGTVRNTGYNRFNIRGSFKAHITENLTFDMNMSMRRSVRYQPGYDMGVQGYFDPIQRANYMIPIISNTYTEPGTGKVYPLGLASSGACFSPDSSLDQSGWQRAETWEYAGRGNLQYAFAEDGLFRGLKLNVFAGLNYSMSMSRQFLQYYQVYAFDRNTLDVTKVGAEGIDEHNFNKTSSYSYSFTLRPQISYDRTFGKHAVSALALFERTSNYSEWIYGAKKGYAAIEPVDINTGTVQADNPVNGGYGRSGDLGFVGRLSWNYDGKYLVEASFREETSWKFPPGNRWAFFPSVSMGWNISKEDFMKGIGWLDNLKIRASIGQLGSDDTSAYQWLSTFASSGSVTWSLDGRPVYGFYTTNAYNYWDLTWSHTTAYNAGFDLAVLRNKLNVELDVFYKYTDRILEASGGNDYAPSLGGANPTWMNTGTMDDRGFELSVTHTNFLPSGFNYSLRGTLVWARNKVLSRKVADAYSVNNQIVGRSLGAWYGFLTDGFLETDEDVLAAPVPPSGFLEKGALKYVDINGDGRITRDNRDYVWLGYSQVPEMNFSFNVDLGYKGFALSALFYGVTMTNFPICGYYSSSGHSDGTMFTRPWIGPGGNAFKHVVEQAWDPTPGADNSNANYPRVHSYGRHNSNNDVLSDFWMKDGSYLRLKNLQISYTLPKSVSSKLKMSKLMVYVAGTNLWTLCSYPYLDPENPGVNNGYYPLQRTGSIGANITF